MTTGVEWVLNWNHYKWCTFYKYKIHQSESFFGPSPDSLTTIPTWAHLALETHMKANWVNDPQAALTTL